MVEHKKQIFPNVLKRGGLYMPVAKWAWCNGLYVLQEELVTPVMNRGLHYGAGAFEGIRFYDTKDGPAIFRLHEHMERFYHSCTVLGAPLPFNTDDFARVMVALIRKNTMREGYIRPIVWFGGEGIGVSINHGRFDVAISLFEWNKKVKPIRALVSPIMRIHPKTTDVGAKLSGVYINSIQALSHAERRGFDEVILLDYRGEVAEASGSNIFRVRHGVLTTPPLGTILPGVTRATVIELAKQFGYRIYEKRITPSMLFNADEVFLTGTAVEVISVGEIHQEGRKPWRCACTSATDFFAKLYHDTVRGEVAQSSQWLTFIKDHG